jgi:hypothetical protein
MRSVGVVTDFVTAAPIPRNRFGDFIRTVVRGHG